MKRRANGEGTVFKRKDGRWSAQTFVTLVNGAQKRICITARTHERVREKLREVLEQERRRVPYSEKDWTVAEYLDYWMQEVQSVRIRETTAIAYKIMIEKVQSPS